MKAMKDVPETMNKPSYLKRILLGASVLAVVVGSLASSMAANRGTVVVFDANWCASCREIVPIAQEVATQNSLGFVEIDIDTPSAPKQAHSYGLSIPNEDPPQIYYVERGGVTQLFSGRGYRFGAADTARATILQNLQRALK